MKKFLFVVSVAVLAFGAVACGETDPDLKCDATCNGSLQTNQCEVLNSALYTGGTVTCNLATCSVDTSGCTLVPDGSRQEFETCTPDTTAQGDCTDGLICQTDGGTSICFTECDPAAATDPCGTGRGCAELTGGGGICFGATATRDTECLDNFQFCAAGEGECGTAGFDDNDENIFRCKIECDQADIGGVGSCTGGESCVASGIISGLVPDQTCTNAGTVDTCTEGSCYAGWSDGQTRCANQVAYCGTIAPLLDNGFLGYQGHTGVPTNLCDDIDGHAMCAIQGAVGDEALALCEDFGAGGACITICEDDTGAELDCGNNGTANPWFCRVPADDQAIFFNVQRNGTVPVTCTTEGTQDNCDPGGGFMCYNLSSGLVCSRPYKMCFSTETP